MATEDAGTPDTRERSDEVIDLAKDEATIAPSPTEAASEQVGGGAEAVGRQRFRDVGYAAVGVGDAVAKAVRNTDTSALAERFRRRQGTVTSKMSGMGTTARSRYLALAARGRRVRLQSAAEPTTSGTDHGLDAAVNRVKSAVRASRKDTT